MNNAAATILNSTVAVRADFRSRKAADKAEAAYPLLVVNVGAPVTQDWRICGPRSGVTVVMALREDAPEVAAALKVLGGKKIKITG